MQSQVTGQSIQPPARNESNPPTPVSSPGDPQASRGVARVSGRRLGHTDNEHRVLWCIPSGRERAWSGERIGRWLTISKRSVQQAIESLRLSGHLICSSTAGDGGYYLPADADEARESIEALHRRVMRQLGVWSAQKQAYEARYGPLQLTLPIP